MQGSVAQLLCLVAHGNSFLAGRALPAFWPDHPAFRFCKAVRFVDLARDGEQWRESPYAENPWRWLEALKKADVRALRAIHVPRNDGELSDRMSVAFVGGGGRWLLECATPAGADLWEASWEAGDRNDADQAIWQVTYGRVAKGIAIPPQPRPPLPELHRDLALVLADIRDFADAHDYRNFGECFDRGLRALAGSNGSGFRLAPPDWLPPEAEQLIAACEAASVFGGMGSWNDVGFAEPAAQQQYEQLSDRLFALINSALVAAVNSHLPGDDAAPTASAPAARPWWKLW